MSTLYVPGIPVEFGDVHGENTKGLKAVTLHRTYGSWAGDDAVIDHGGLAQWLIGKDPGNWRQYMGADEIAYHCNGANFVGPGIELEGTNEDVLTDWQVQCLGTIAQWCNANLNIPLTYQDPATTPPASIHVNDGNFYGFISHASVMTDDGSAQHSDLVTMADWQRAVGTAPTPQQKGKRNMTLIQTQGLRPDEVYITDEMHRRRLCKWEVDLYTGLFGAKIQARPYEAFHALADVTPADFKYTA